MGAGSTGGDPTDSMYPLDEATMRLVTSGAQDYKGWRCDSAKDGILMFTKGYEHIAVEAHPRGRTDWLQFCWNNAVRMIDRKESEPAPTITASGERKGAPPISDR